MFGEALSLWSSAAHWRRLGAHVLDLVLPPRPLDGAAAVGVQSQGLSPTAWTAVRFIGPPACDACATPFEFDLGGALCPACLEKRPDFDRARAACLYDEASRDLILQFKHADRIDLSPLLTRWLARAAADLAEDVDAVTAVPMHRTRLLARRYKQAAELARPLARSLGKAYWPDVLTRGRDTGTQGGRSASGRRRNVQGAFQVPDRWTARLKGARVLVVDDVLTTGATLNACARALKRRGARGVDVVTIARVQTLTRAPI